MGGKERVRFLVRASFATVKALSRFASDAVVFGDKEDVDGVAPLGEITRR